MKNDAYYAVIFTTSGRIEDQEYKATAQRMEELAKQQPGYLGMDSISNNNEGISISYWESMEAIQAWKSNPEHQSAQQLGKEKWYQHYKIKICKVEREYEQ